MLTQMTAKLIVVWSLLLWGRSAVGSEIDVDGPIKPRKGLLDSLLLSSQYELHKRHGFGADNRQQDFVNNLHPDLDLPTNDMVLSLPGDAESYDFPEMDDPEITFTYEDASYPDDLSRRSVNYRERSVPVFQPLCPYSKNIVLLDQKVYKQPSYEEITCLHPYGPSYDSKKNKVCGGSGFMCIQKTRKIILVKRNRSGSNCYETESRTINFGCDCMWPKHIHGEIEHKEL